MKFFSTCAAIAGMATIAHAHMEMKDPPPFRSKFNKNAGSNIDYSMTSPLEASGSNYPCKGYHKDFGTPAGKPVAEWTPGQSYKMSITGGANHGGGSCQASLSFDKGASWKVIHSYIGNCPLAGESSFDFKLPADTPGGDAIFAWTWFNKIGNREMYMNCAAITVKAPSAKLRMRAASVAMSARPKVYVANLGTDQCKTIEGTDLDFPEPGPDVTRNSQVAKGPSCAGGSGGDSSPPSGGSAGDNGNTGGNSGGNTGGNTGGDSGSPPPSQSTLYVFPSSTDLLTLIIVVEYQTNLTL